MDDNLKVYDNDYECYVGRDLPHVLELFRRDVRGPYEGDGWVEIKPEEAITVYYDKPEDKYPEQAVVETEEIKEGEDTYWHITVTATAEAWAKFNGPGILCSTEV